MKNEGAATPALNTEDTAEKQEALAPKKGSELKSDGFKPIFVEAEKMFEQLAEFTKETARKAYEFFHLRGGEFGKEFDDWFRAETEILMPVRAEITETADKINVRATVPGFKPEEIQVSVKDNLLILSGETEKREKREDENTIFSEWLNTTLFRWSYSQLMPTLNIAGFELGVAPLFQWLILPPLALNLARRSRTWRQP